MTVGSSWLKQIMNLFIYDLNEANFDREGEVGVHVSCASSILPVTLILQNVEKVVSKEWDQARIRAVTLHAMSFATASCAEHENWNVNSFCERTKIRWELM